MRERGIHDGAGIFHHEAQHRKGIGRNVIERTHGRGIGQLRGDPGARTVESQRRAAHHSVADLLRFRGEIARALERRLRVRQIDPEQQPGALAGTIA